MIPSGIRGASRANTLRSTSSVARLRALTPMTVAPASSARSSSSLGVHLDQRHQADRDRPLHQRDQRVLLQRGHDQQHQVGPVGPGLPELVGADHEVLAQHRHLHRVPDRGQVLQAAAEPARLGQHADHARAAGLVVHGQRGRVGDRGQRALGRAGPLDLGDDGDVGALERGHDVARRRRPRRRLLQAVKRDIPLPRRQVGTHSLEDVVEHAHAVLLPPRVGCLAPRS